jgi:hypothetical protein
VLKELSFTTSSRHRARIDSIADIRKLQTYYS